MCDGYHNGYGWERIWLKTPVGTLIFDSDGGSYDVYINKESFPSDIVHKERVYTVLSQIMTQGFDDDGTMVLNLYEEEDSDRVELIDAILESAGLDSPWYLNLEDGTLRAQYVRPLKEEKLKTE